MVGHEEAGSISAIIVLQPRNIPGNLGIAIRQGQIRPTPNLSAVIKHGPILVEIFDVGSEPLEGLHCEQPEWHGGDYDGEVQESRGVEDLLLAVFVEFDEGIHFVDGEDVRWRRWRIRR